jgi:hypothetical protein
MDDLLFQRTVEGDDAFSAVYLGLGRIAALHPAHPLYTILGTFIL